MPKGSLDTLSSLFDYGVAIEQYVRTSYTAQG